MELCIFMKGWPGPPVLRREPLNSSLWTMQLKNCRWLSASRVQTVAIKYNSKLEDVSLFPFFVLIIELWHTCKKCTSKSTAQGTITMWTHFVITTKVKKSNDTNQVGSKMRNDKCNLFLLSQPGYKFKGITLLFFYF